MTSLPSLGRVAELDAKIAATLVVLTILGGVAGLWTMPVTHRLVFIVVFGWIVTTSCRRLQNNSYMRETDLGVAKQAD